MMSSSRIEENLPKSWGLYLKGLAREATVTDSLINAMNVRSLSLRLPVYLASSCVFLSVLLSSATETRVLVISQIRAGFVWSCYYALHGWFVSNLDNMAIPRLGSIYIW